MADHQFVLLLRRQFRQAQLDVAAGNLFALVDALDRLGPGFGEDAALRAAFAVDGVMQTDWSAPLAPDALVMVFPRVAGG